MKLGGEGSTRLIYVEFPAKPSCSIKAYVVATAFVLKKKAPLLPTTHEGILTEPPGRTWWLIVRSHIWVCSFPYIGQAQQI